MSADGNLKPSSMPQRPTIHHKRAEPKCALCDRSLHGTHPVLLKSGQSLHIDCYFKMQKAPRGGRTN